MLHVWQHYLTAQCVVDGASLAVMSIDLGSEFIKIGLVKVSNKINEIVKF